jgi:hypothetical protein
MYLFLLLSVCIRAGSVIGVVWSGVKFETDFQPASSSWCRAAILDPWPDFTCSLDLPVFSSSYRVPSLTRGRVWIFQCTSLTGQSREGPVTKYCSPIWDSLDLKDQAPHPYPQEKGGTVIPLGTGFPIRRLLRPAGLWWRYSNPPPHGLNIHRTSYRSNWLT